MKKKCIFLKNVALILFYIFILINNFSTVSFCNEKTEKETQKKQLEEKVEKIAKEKTEVDNKIKTTKNIKNKKLHIKKNLDDQISGKKQEIFSLNKKITSLNQDIIKKQNEISGKEDEIKENKDLLKSRLKSGFVAPRITQIEAMMQKDKYSEFLANAEYQARISIHDKDLVDSLVVKLKEIQSEKQQVEVNKRNIELTKGKIEEAKKTLDMQMDEVNKEVYSIEKEEAAYLKDSANLKKQMDALQAEIARICRELSSDNAPYVGGEFAWPVPGYYSISSPYGPRSFDGFHTGVDIAGRGIYGKNVVAANDGKVIFVNYGSKSLYGNYIMVDHGGGIVTLYAHLSSVLISYGENVNKGKVIGLVGSTGNSTGPHLHFEVRIHGKHTNPMVYFKKG